MKVLKFGGTSVGTAARLRTLPALLPAHTPHIVVLSAMSGTTNTLVRLAQLLRAGHRPAATEQLRELRTHYYAVAHELLPDAAVLAEALPALEACFGRIAALLSHPLTTAGERIILAQGELLSTLLFHRYLTGMLGQTVVLLPALEFMRLRPDQEPDTEHIETHLAQLLRAHAGCQCFITQGYICRDAQGQVANLQRGGSDYSATLIGAAIRAAEVQIWTDIDGLHNNDPRVVEHTYPIRELSFDEAADLAYFGAKILHPSSVLPARQHGIPVRLLNTMQPEAPGTLISAHTATEGVKAVAVKDGILAIRVHSNRKTVAYDFLTAVFEIFRRHHLRADLVTTTDASVLLAVEQPAMLPALLEELRTLGTTTVVESLSILCVVGKNLVRDVGKGPHLLVRALRTLNPHLISYGASSDNICFLINTTDKVAALRLLNKRVFNGPESVRAVQVRSKPALVKIGVYNSFRHGVAAVAQDA